MNPRAMQILGLAGLAVAGLAAWLSRGLVRAEPAADLAEKAPGLVELEPAPINAADTAERNTAAFLAMIRQAEGTGDVNGYRALFGHTAARPKLFESFDAHPRQAFTFTGNGGRKLWTSAAGAYQFMAASPIPGGGSTKVDTWTETARRLDLQDFSPASQDAAATELIRQAGALGDVQAGRLPEAVRKVRGRWASLPGAGYGQPERSLETITAAYRGAGGTTA